MPVIPQLAVVHPLVLLSVVDNYNRVAKGTRKRVVGVLLGEIDKSGQVDVTNSYAIPFDEDERDPHIWFFDHNYHENMFSMFRKVSIKERVVGWYSTGPKIRPSDIEINEVIRRYTDNPVLVIIDVKPNELGIPTKAYISVEEVSEDGSETRAAFQHIPSSIGALEAEEVGVEHLLRDVKDASVSTLATDINDKSLALQSLTNHIGEMEEYLSRVINKKLPINHQIINQLQDIFNLMPNLTVESMVKSFSVKTNDMMLVIYLSSMIRSVIALHNLINNKIQNKEIETQAAQQAKERQRDKEEVEDLKKKVQAEKDAKNAAQDANGKD